MNAQLSARQFDYSTKEHMFLDWMEEFETYNVTPFDWEQWFVEEGRGWRFAV